MSQQTKFCPDCKCDQPIENFGKPQKNNQHRNGKTYAYIYMPCYCKHHAYLRSRKCLTRNERVIERNKNYQKKYNPTWQKVNRKKQLQKPKTVAF